MSDVVFVDTNILIYAHDADAGVKRERAIQKLRRLWESDMPDSMDKALARQSAASGLSKSDLAREALGPISTWANFASSGASSFRLRRHVGFTPSHLNRSTRTLSSS